MTDQPLVLDDAEMPTEKNAAPAAPVRIDGMRVLLAEDGIDNQRLIAHLVPVSARVHRPRPTVTAAAVAARDDAGAQAGAGELACQPNGERRLAGAAHGEIAHYHHRPADALELTSSLFWAWLILGDDRNLVETWVAGVSRHRRDGRSRGQVSDQ